MAFLYFDHSWSLNSIIAANERIVKAYLIHLFICLNVWRPWNIFMNYRTQINRHFSISWHIGSVCFGSWKNSFRNLTEICRLNWNILQVVFEEYMVNIFISCLQSSFIIKLCKRCWLVCAMGAKSKLFSCTVWTCLHGSTTTHEVWGIRQPGGVLHLLLNLHTSANALVVSTEEILQKCISA
jgi:hypothetical protein